MTHHDVTRREAQLLLTREATLAAHYGRRFEQAVGNGDLGAARRWSREYRLSAFRCRMLGTLDHAHAKNRPIEQVKSATRSRSVVPSATRGG